MCGLLNLGLLTLSGAPPRDRALVAFGYGPAFVPLGLTHPRATITIAGKRLPVRAGAQLVGGGVLLLCVLPVLLSGGGGAHRARWQRLVRNHARDQGRLPPSQIRKQLRMDGPGLPLARVEGTVIGIPYGADRGHVAVIAPTRSGKGLHLTDTLLRWPGAAVVLDPQGRIFAATADDRTRSGPIYHLPDHSIDLAALFDLHAAQDVVALHAALLGYAQDRDPSFAAHSLPLLHAAIAAGNATGEHPLQVLARWTAMAAPQALAEAHHYAPAAVRQFTGGDDSSRDGLSRFAHAAWGTLTTRLCPLIPHLTLLTQPDIPADWHQHPATVYVTLPLDARTSTLVTCIVEGCLWAVQRQPTQPPVLLVLDDGVPRST